MDDKRALLAVADGELGGADQLDAVQRIVRRAARHLVDADGATLVLLEGAECFYADEDAMSPLWKGQRFPVTDCISGWSMLHRQVAVVPDVTVDERIPQDAYRPTFVKSLAMVPIDRQAPVGAIGAYWADPHETTDAELALLADLAANAAAPLRRLLGA